MGFNAVVTMDAADCPRGLRERGGVSGDLPREVELDSVSLHVAVCVDTFLCDLVSALVYALSS